MIKYILILLLTPNLVLADCDIPTPIKQNDKSPCNGYVISEDTELKIRTDLIYKQSLIDNLTKTNELQKEINLINDEQIKIYRQQSNNYRELSTLEKTFYFSLGAVLTGVTAYGVIKILK